MKLILLVIFFLIFCSVKLLIVMMVLQIQARWLIIMCTDEMKTIIPYLRSLLRVGHILLREPVSGGFVDAVRQGEDALMDALLL